MTHPAIQKTSQLILAGDLEGAENALMSFADEEGDTALVAVLEQFPPKDLLAVMREFDSSKESIINMVITPEKFAQTIVLEQLYRDQTHNHLRGMMNAVIHRDPDRAGEYLEAIGEAEDGYGVLADYFSERFDEVLEFAMTGVFGEDFGAEAPMENKTVAWLAEKIDEIDEALHHGDGINDVRPKCARSEIADGDWMETAWLLRHEHPDIFEQVIILLRDRMNRLVQAEEQVVAPTPAADEESAI